MTEASSAPQQPAAAPAASAANPAAQPAASASGSSLSKLTAPLSEARQAIENLKDSANYASDAAIKSTTQALAVAISMGLQQFNETRKVACQLWKEGQAYVDSGVAQIKQAEDAAVSSIKSSVATAAALPAYCTYPAIGLGTLLLLPATRRAMYNATIGRLRSPEAIAKTSAGRVEGLKTKLEEVSGEAQKLSERMRAAEEEMRWVMWCCVSTCCSAARVFVPLIWKYLGAPAGYIDTSRVY